MPINLARNKGDYLGFAPSVTVERVKSVFSELKEDVQNDLLPPLPEISIIAHAFWRKRNNTDTLVDISRAMYRLKEIIVTQRDHLRFIFESLDFLAQQCNCLTLARIWPIELSPVREGLREIYRKDDDIYDKYIDYVCKICGTKWRLEDASSETITDSCWRLQEIPGDVVLPDYDKYGRALAESRSQVALTLDDLTHILAEQLSVVSNHKSYYRSTLKNLAMLGLVGRKDLEGVITENLGEAKKKWPYNDEFLLKVIVDLFLDKEAEKWPI